MGIQFVQGKIYGFCYFQITSQKQTLSGCVSNHQKYYGRLEGFLSYVYEVREIRHTINICTFSSVYFKTEGIFFNFLYVREKGSGKTAKRETNLLDRHFRFR